MNEVLDTNKEDVVIEPQESGDKRDEKGRFAEGNIPQGHRPKGSFSPITRIKQIFAEDPEKFDAFVRRYMEGENNDKHLVEMLDGKPFQKSDITTNGKELPQPLLFALKGNELQNNHSNRKDISAE